MNNLFFKDWETLRDISLCSLSAFITVFTLVRLSGKRTLAKLTAFDFIVTVTLGSTLSSMILNKVSIVDGTVALVIIVLFQYVLAWLARSSKSFEKIINTHPTLLFYDGKFLTSAMKFEGITEDEIYAEIRLYRLENLEDVKAVVLELNGEISVIKKAKGESRSSIEPLLNKIISDY